MKNSKKEKAIATFTINGAGKLHEETVAEIVEWLEGIKRTITGQREELSDKFTANFLLG